MGIQFCMVKELKLCNCVMSVGALICKTHRLSMFQHGIDNWPLNFAMIFEAVLAIVLIYCPGTDVGLNMQRLRITWWLPAIPFTLLMFVYEEFRKLIIRNQDQGSWLERETCY